MDRKIYDSMKKIYSQKASDFNNQNDIKFIGTMVYTEEDHTGKVPNVHDVFIMNFKDSNGNINQTYYNENGECLGRRGIDGKIYPSSKFAEADLSFLGQLERLSANQGLSLDELDKNMEKIAKELGVSKESVKSMTEIDLEQKIDEKEKNDDEKKDKISLDKNHEQTQNDQLEENEKKLEKINAKEEINMDRLIDDRHSLADILGIESGCKLIAVYSDAIVDNTNSTRFSFVIQKPDGSLEPADMLEQTGGTHSDKTVYETNRDGSDISKVNINSSFKINSPLVKNVILNIRYGSLGYVEADYGEVDPTDHKYAFTQKLETDRDRYTTYEVRKEFSNREDGIHNIEQDIDEIKKHEEVGCDKLTLKEADGHLDTGHFHDTAIDDIKSYDPNISEIFTDREIEDRLHKMMDNHPEESFDKVVNDTARDLSDDASHLRSRDNH